MLAVLSSSKDLINCHACCCCKTLRYAGSIVTELLDEYDKLLVLYAARIDEIEVVHSNRFEAEGGRLDHNSVIDY